LAVDVPLGWGVNVSTTFEGITPLLKIWEGKNIKRSKIGVIYDNFRVWVQISLKQMKIATKCKWRSREWSFWHWKKKILWTSVHYEQSYKRSCWLTLSRQCAFCVCHCIWVRATWLWCRGNL